MLIIILAILGFLVVWALEKASTERRVKVTQRDQLICLLRQLFGNGFDFYSFDNEMGKKALQTCLQYGDLPYSWTNRLLTFEGKTSDSGIEILWKQIGPVLSQRNISRDELSRRCPTLSAVIADYRNEFAQGKFIEVIKVLNGFLKSTGSPEQLYLLYGDVNYLNAFQIKTISGVVLTENLYDIVVRSSLVKSDQIPHLVPQG